MPTVWKLRYTRGPNPYDRWERQAISEPARPFLTVACPICRTGTTIDSENTDLLTAVFVHCCGIREAVPTDLRRRITEKVR